MLKFGLLMCVIFSSCSSSANLESTPDVVNEANDAGDSYTSAEFWGDEDLRTDESDVVDNTSDVQNDGFSELDVFEDSQDGWDVVDSASDGQADDFQNDDTNSSDEFDVDDELPYFPVHYDTARIRLLEESIFEYGGYSLRWLFFENRSYKCGLGGNFTFVIVESTERTGYETPLWVLLHGGGVGYYDEDGQYHGGEDNNAYETRDDLLAVLREHVFDGDNVKDTIVVRRMLDGYRLMVPSMCDHDLYAGMGTTYPNNPNPEGNGTVDGLLATMAAVDFTVNGNDSLQGFRTSLVFIHGTSAGSAGAYHVAHAFARNGIFVNGVVMDSYLVSARTEDLFEAGCTPMQRDSQFELSGVQEKIGPFVSEPLLFAETTVRGTFSVPLFDLVADGDEHCCGRHSVLPVAQAAGYNNNCRYLHGLLREETNGISQVMIVDRDAHVLTKSEGAHQDAIDSWHSSILASNPRPPW